MEQTISFPTTITDEKIQDLPLTHYSGSVQVIARNDQIEGALNAITQEMIVGFDTESKPSFKRGVAYSPSLLQIATANEVFLFQLKKLRFPNPLFSILSDSNILKVGIALSNDLRDLKKISPFEPHGFLDIAAHMRAKGVVKTGLRNMAAMFLRIRISKSAQRSNWGRRRLSQTQLIYAATDAWVSRRLYIRLRELNLV